MIIAYVLLCFGYIIIHILMLFICSYFLIIMQYGFIQFPAFALIISIFRSSVCKFFSITILALCIIIVCLSGCDLN